jgi:hypothetical protein
MYSLATGQYVHVTFNLVQFIKVYTIITRSLTNNRFIFCVIEYWYCYTRIVHEAYNETHGLTIIKLTRRGFVQKCSFTLKSTKSNTENIESVQNMYSKVFKLIESKPLMSLPVFYESSPCPSECDFFLLYLSVSYKIFEFNFPWGVLNRHRRSSKQQF